MKKFEQPAAPNDGSIKHKTSDFDKVKDEPIIPRFIVWAIVAILIIALGRA